MRQVVLDTETTGIGAEQGHRIIEIGCIEVIDRVITDKTFHVYLNPEREVDEGAFKVHGISNEFLQDKPKFNTVLASFLDFVKDAELIIHNAAFDTAFINAEFKRCAHAKRIEDYCGIVDSLALARHKHPGQRNNLDALCKRYDIDNTHRELHGALLDAQILAQVYLAMTGGQTSMFHEESAHTESNLMTHSSTIQSLKAKTQIIFANAEEQREHEALMALITQKSGKHYWSD